MSTVSLAPVASQDSSSNNFSSSLGGLAELSGLSVGGPGYVDRTTLGLEQLRSRKFISEFMQKYDVYKDLIAVKDWDKSSNKFSYDRKIYDHKNKKWNKKPSFEESYRAFNSIFYIKRDDETGVITLSMEHYSPIIAKEWLSLVIDEINSISRIDEIDMATNSLSYLTNEIEDTKLTEIRSGLTNLALSQHEKIMLAKVTPEYLFKIIDPPYIPETKSKPKRSVLTILGFFLGLFLGILFFLFDFLLKRNKKV